MTTPVLTLHSDSPSVTHDIGAVIGVHAKPGDIIRLSGELGAGKTALVRGIARGMRLDNANVNSPTYTLANEYRAAHALLLHIDAYRIDEAEEALDTIGLSEALHGGAVACIEWPEVLGDALPDAALSVELMHTGEHTREIAINGSMLAREGERLIRSLNEAGGTR